MDLGDVVVHIMQPAIRDYYRLEDLWGETPIELDEITAPFRKKSAAKKPAAKKPAAKKPAAKKSPSKSPSKAPSKKPAAKKKS